MNSMNRQTLEKYISECSVLPVFRTEDTAGLLCAAGALYAGGMRVIEFTMTMPQPLRLIEQAVAELPQDALIGAGTVLDVPTARAAMLAGAQFIVSPVLDLDIIDACHRYGVPVIPGVFTPTEIQQACRLGVDFVKVFPACSLGPRGLSELLGPFPGLHMIASGIGGLQYVSDYIAAGAEAVCVAGQEIDAVAYSKRQADVLTSRARELVAIAQRSRR